MRTTTILAIVSLLSLVALILPPILFLAGSMAITTTKWLMLLATIVWFVTAAPWMWKDNNQQSEAN